MGFQEPPMPTHKSPQPDADAGSMTELEASFEAAIAEAERDGYVSAEEGNRRVKKLLEGYAKLAAEGKVKP
jgi:hypothetical protein